MNNDFLGTGAGAGVATGADNTGLVFDLSNVEEDKGFELLPKGDYPAVVDEMEFGDSKAGNPMVTVKYKITEGEFADRVLFDYWVLDGKGKDFGLGKLKKFLVRVCPDADLSAFNPQTFCDEAAGIGRECVLVVKITTQKKGEYKGEKRNNVADVKAAATGSFL